MIVRARLLGAAGLIALAATLAGAPVRAQSFQGSASIVGNASVATSANHTQITVAGDRAIITWTPSDTSSTASGSVNFQPAGTSATFSSAAQGLTDFTVLNIVNAPGSRQIGLYGAVDTKVADGRGGAVTGGTVWFYSRNGFLVGSSARFDIGSLMLTADRPQGIDDPSSPDGFNHAFDIRRQRLAIEAGSTGTIQIAQGAQINASNYVALVAPHVVQGGTVRAAGEIAYVGAESVDMTMPISGGLFGIAILTGTDGVAITQTGSTGGPATTDFGQTRNIYMVTVPKNQAVTMLLGGSIGYDATLSAAALADGTILLAGGSGAVSGGTIVAQPALSALPATIAISGARFSSQLTAVGSGITIAATGPLSIAGATATGGDLAVTTDDALRVSSATASGAVRLTTSNGPIAVTSLTAGSGATLSATGAIGVSNAAVSGNLSATGLSVAVTGTRALTLANATATGGPITLAALDGALTVAHLATPGSVSLTASGTITATDIVAAGGVTARGTTLNLESSGALTLTSATALTGTLTASAAGNLTLTAGTAPDKIALTSSAGSITIGSATSAGQLSADAATAIDIQTVAADAISLRARNGAINAASLAANGSVTLGASGAIAIGDLAGSAASAADGASVTIGATGTLSLAHVGATNGDITLRSQGDLMLAQASATGAIDLESAGGAVNGAGLSTAGVTARGTSVTLAGAGALAVTDASATAGDVTLRSVNDLAIASATATGAVGATSSAGSITAASITSGGALTLAAARNVGFTALTGASLDLTASGGTLSGTTLATSGVARLRASGALSVTGDLAAVGGADVQGGSVTLAAAAPLTLTSAIATAGDLAVTGASDLIFASAAASRAARITSGRAVRITNASVGGDLNVTAATATLDGTIVATGAITVAATDARITGALTGKTIGLASNSIAIGTAARIGLAGTTTGVTFTNSGTQRSFIGGTAGNGYLLTATGLGRVQADAITLNLPATIGSSAATPDVVIGDLTLHGSNGTATGTLANLTANGSLTITTPGRVEVSGKVALTDLASTNSLVIVAGPELDVVIPNGSILLTNTAGAPAGGLDLTAQRIVVASQAALTDLAGLTDTAARNTRLSANDGVTSDQGYMVADHLTFRIATALDVQNSGGGATADRRGLTSGSGGVDVIASGTAPEVIINGRQMSSTGSGLPALVRVAGVNGAAAPALAAGSNVNACTVGTANCGTPPVTTLLALVTPQQDSVAVVSGGGSDDDDKKSAGSSKKPARIAGAQPLLALPRTTMSSLPVVIDEPVIGAPNDDLWIDRPVTPAGGN